MNRGSLRLPDFIAVGPPRTGTTWFDRILRGRVGLPAGTKETQFFTWRYWLGMEWYAAHFRDCPPDLPIGEIAPTYFASEEARERIARELPGCKIIVTLRDPVERFYSHYKIWRKIGATRSSLERAAERHKELLSFNNYAFHIREWQRTFGAENVLAVIYDDSATDQQGYIDRLCAFIGIPTIVLKDIPWQSEPVQVLTHAPRSHRLARRARAVKGFLERKRLYSIVDFLMPAYEFCTGRGEKWPRLDTETQARLREQFRPQVEDLETLLHRDLSAWKPPKTGANALPENETIAESAPDHTRNAG
jgi:Sulfotransferase domain